MLHIKFQGNWVSGSGEEDFLRFLPLWAWWPSWSCDLDQIYKFARRLLTKSNFTDRVSEKSFENVDTQLTIDLWPRSPNDLDL